MEVNVLGRLTFNSVQQTTSNDQMKVIQDLAALYSALLLLTGESGQVRVVILQKL